VQGRLLIASFGEAARLRLWSVAAMDITLQVQAVDLKISLKLYLDTTRQQLCGLQHVNSLLQMCTAEVEFDPDQQAAWHQLQKHAGTLKVMRHRIRHSGHRWHTRWAPDLSPIPSPEVQQIRPRSESLPVEANQVDGATDSFELAPFTWMDGDVDKGRSADADSIAAETETDEGLEGGEAGSQSWPLDETSDGSPNSPPLRDSRESGDDVPSSEGPSAAGQSIFFRCSSSGPDGSRMRLVPMSPQPQTKSQHREPPSFLTRRRFIRPSDPKLSSTVE